MLELATAAKAAGRDVRYLRLNEAERRYDVALLHALGSNSTVFLDGAEQLTFFRWRLFLHRVRLAGQLLIAVHATGRLPTLQQTGASAELLRDLLADLVGQAPEPALCEQWLAACGGNIRLVFHRLYREMDGGAPETGLFMG